MDLISVIVPVYKTEEYLDRCVNSIVNQTYKNLEIILVDDGSPDNCPEMCDEWAKKDERIKVIHQKNGGMSAARNAGLKIAKGDYIGFVDSDDWIDNDMYEYLYILLINNQADYSTINYDIKKRETDRTENQNECINLLDNNRMFEIFFRVITSDIRYCVWDKLYKKSLLQDINFLDGMRFEDIFFNYQFLQKCRKGVCSNIIKYHWFYNINNSITRNYLVPEDLQMIDIWGRIMDDCKINHPSYVYYAKMNYERSYMTTIAKALKYGVSNGYSEWELKRKECVSHLRKHYFELLKWKMPFSRKMLLTGICISPEFCLSMLEKSKTKKHLYNKDKIAEALFR